MECSSFDSKVKKKLCNIINELFNIDIDLSSIKEDVLEANLMSNKVGCTPRDLIYLYLKIEEEFNITIPQEAIVNNRFTSINNIFNIIIECSK